MTSVVVVVSLLRSSSFPSSSTATAAAAKAVGVCFFFWEANTEAGAVAVAVPVDTGMMKPVVVPTWIPIHNTSTTRLRRREPRFHDAVDARRPSGRRRRKDILRFVVVVIVGCLGDSLRDETISSTKFHSSDRPTTPHKQSPLFCRSTITSFWTCLTLLLLVDGTISMIICLWFHVAFHSNSARLR